MNIDNGRRAILRDADQLIKAGLAPESARAELEAVCALTAVAITPAAADLIDPNDPADPIARQYVPSAAELNITQQERADPIGDDAYSPLPGVVHRYPDRMLLKPIMVCPVYCRFCFRRESVGDADGTLSPQQLDDAFAYAAARPEIREIIVTGGDPLMLNAARLRDLVARTQAIGHVEVLRLHSRVPAADPARIDADMAAALRSGGDLAVWVSVHVNHPREVTAQMKAGLAVLADAGIALISQTVLLAGVNDDALVLEELFRALIRCRVRPYYLHHPDLARGTSHFRPSIARGQDIMRQLRGRLSGIAQPVYVLDIPGGAGKVPLGPDYWDSQNGRVTDRQGLPHPYPG